MNHFDPLLPLLREQLCDNEGFPANFYAEARHAKSLIAFAILRNNTSAERAAAAAYGGLVKRWRRWLIELITESALAECDTSRAGVRAWQQRVFGQSVASDRLRHYAKPERSGAGRPIPLVLADFIEPHATAFFLQHQDDIKQV